MSAVLKETVHVSLAAPRYNIYRVIHKALRAFMADTLLKIGKMDAGDDGERTEALAQLRGLLEMCDSHLRHENEFIHTAIEQVRPRATARTVEDHHHHEAALARLEREIVQFESAAPELRPALAQDLYLSLSQFVAENFTHMITEETENHTALIGAYDESQVLTLEQSLVASLSPEEKFTAMRWMIPHINASERAFLLGGMKRHAPPPAFDAVLGLARERLTQRDFHKLERALA
jgi:hypothetical protein